MSGGVAITVKWGTRVLVTLTLTLDIVRGIYTCRDGNHREILRHVLRQYVLVQLTIAAFSLSFSFKLLPFL